MALTPEQRRVLAQIKQVARETGASPKQIKAAIETGLVESGLRNLSGGDRDSAGWRQERASLYKDPTNLRASISRFFDETAAVKDKYGRAGDLAAAVQRPAAQFRGRYEQRSGEAAALMGRAGSGFSPSNDASSSTTTQTVGGVDNSGARRMAIAQFLQSTRTDPLDLAVQLKGLQDVPGQKVTTTTQGSRPSQPDKANGSDVSREFSRADAISKQKLPYSWGGGHQPGGAKPGQPLDCSGAVSKVLGINPKVSGEFTSWGKPGDGGNRGVTVYANKGHVLMKIDGRFWGTSAANPGGGAGWIPQSKISPEYLKGFTARHA